MAVSGTNVWPRRPIIYEVNAWVWLNELSRRYGRHIGLGEVPTQDWDQLANQGFDGVWLMGVWERSPAGRDISLSNPAIVEECQRTLPDFSPEDVSGSPYCIRRYTVDAHLGGREGLAAARRALGERGLRLLLDFVPNHVAPDHPWVIEHSEYFVHGTLEDAEREPSAFFEIERGAVLARGRDPYFPAWPDTVQVNAFSAGLRRAATDTLKDIAAQCDGVRCDMAMLLLNSIFSRTWKERAGPMPGQEYWREVIGSVKQMFPAFLFIAEAYWDLEWELQQQGFDFCYDKRLYDRLVHDDAQSVRGHLMADMNYQDHLIRFLENHDEPRSAATFAEDKGRAAAMVIMTTPGAKLLHEGQFDGARVKLSVHLGRRPEEPLNSGLRTFYRELLHLVAEQKLLEGEWRLCECRGWADNDSSRNLLAWCWHKDDLRCSAVVNYSATTSQGMVQLPWTDLPGRRWRLSDEIHQQVFEGREGNTLARDGLFVSLPPWGFHFMRFAQEEAAAERRAA
ncbi:MAG TPA: alpha-amylase family glycosyl hydrolase [Terriglobales bacterium]|nr:alpha-amylase family glycosyl hydrolase [Terriglobales bacterium]